MHFKITFKIQNIFFNLNIQTFPIFSEHIIIEYVTTDKPFENLLQYNDFNKNNLIL